MDDICEYWRLLETMAVPPGQGEESLNQQLKQRPSDPKLLADAYDLARLQDNWGKRLFYALQLSKFSGTAEDFLRYGIECGRNAMPERAEEAFQKALGLNPNSVSALNGLAMCAFEIGELGRAEELFRKSLKVSPSECAVTMMGHIGRGLKDAPSRCRTDARRKFWEHWKDTGMTSLTDEQRKRRMAEVVARGR